MQHEKHHKESGSSPKSLKIGTHDSAHETAAKESAQQFVSEGMLNHMSNNSGVLPHSGALQSKNHGGQVIKSSNPDVKEQLDKNKGLGHELPGSMKRKMKQQFGGEWGDVRIHTDGSAYDLCADIGANAFAYGTDIYFAPGKYDAHTLEGQGLMGHELAHVAQQKEFGESFIQKSAVVETNPTGPVVKAHIYYYGGEATESVAKAATDEINTMWKEPKGQVSMDDKKSTLDFNVTYSVISEDEAHNKANGNTDPLNNFVRIEKDKNRRDGVVKNRSWMYGGDNIGHWLTADGLGTSTTAAHEFGHGFGLLHAPDNSIGKGQPGIMAARGTMVDAEFTYDPKQGDSRWEYDASKGKNVKKNTINPAKRKVIQSDIDKVWGKVKTDLAGKKFIGAPTNRMLNAMGDVIENKNQK